MRLFLIFLSIFGQRYILFVAILLGLLLASILQMSRSTCCQVIDGPSRGEKGTFR